MFKHRDLQQKLLETKLAQVNLMLKDAEEKHKLERAYVSHMICFNLQYISVLLFKSKPFMNFLVDQLLKQTAEAKMEVTVMKEQENDMKTQVNAIINVFIS